MGLTGKIKTLRVNDLGHVWGPPQDAIRTEVGVVLDSAPDRGFGFELRQGDANLPSRLGMLSVLREAYLRGQTVGLLADVPEGKKNGTLRRVQFGWFLRNRTVVADIPRTRG